MSSITAVRHILMQCPRSVLNHARMFAALLVSMILMAGQARAADNPPLPVQWDKAAPLIHAGKTMHYSGIGTEPAGAKNPAGHRHRAAGCKIRRHDARRGSHPTAHRPGVRGQCRDNI